MTPKELTNQSSSHQWLLFIHVTATCLMVGFIWCIQFVHYPLFHDALKHMDSAGFIEYMNAHQSLITPVVAPLMLIEALTSLWLFRNKFLPKRLLFIGGGLLVVIALSTMLLQVPIHELLAEEALSQEEKGEQIEKLVNTNWIRTIAWSIRAVLVLSLCRGTLSVK